MSSRTEEKHLGDTHSAHAWANPSASQLDEQKRLAKQRRDAACAYAQLQRGGKPRSNAGERTPSAEAEEARVQNLSSRQANKEAKRNKKKRRAATKEGSAAREGAGDS